MTNVLQKQPKTSLTYTKTAWTPLGALPPNPHIASRYRARHWRMTTTYFTTTPLVTFGPLVFEIRRAIFGPLATA